MRRGLFDGLPFLSVTKKKQPLKHNYILHDHQLETVTSAKYLGITLQSNLNRVNILMTLHPMEIKHFVF